ncbi:AI-2E family transporter [Hydrotalea sp.]|uniref:AI-2E family transporter n=2 Tax=Hydrotalea sp. TaxID=2881279 RepID=UPI00258BB2A4|nr:AI-2E family transporter [Hydrotalea sp.]
MKASLTFLQKLAYTLISICLIILLLYHAQSFFIPVAFAALFTLLLISPANAFEKWGISRGISALLAVLLAIILVLIVFYFISSQIIGFKSDLPKVGQQLYIAISDLENWAQQHFHISDQHFKKLIDSVTTQSMTSTSAIVGSTFSTLSNVLVYLVLIPIYTFLLLLYRHIVMGFFVKSFGNAHALTVIDVLHKIRMIIKDYVFGLLIELLIVAVLNYIGLLILGVQYAILLAVVAAILNLIPYLGIYTATLLSMLITYTNNTPNAVLGVAIVMIVVHLIDSNILLPKVVGSKVKINALATILGVVAGSLLWGIPGMFLALPILAILKIIFDSVEPLQSWGYLLGDDSDNSEHVHKKRKNILMHLFKKNTGSKNSKNHNA